jgi:hypothetical protein
LLPVCERFCFRVKVSFGKKQALVLVCTPSGVIPPVHLIGRKDLRHDTSLRFCAARRRNGASPLRLVPAALDMSGPAAGPRARVGWAARVERCGLAPHFTESGIQLSNKQRATEPHTCAGHSALLCRRTTAMSMPRGPTGANWASASLRAPRPECQSYQAIELNIERFVNDAYASGAELLKYTEMGDRTADQSWPFLV